MAEKENYTKITTRWDAKAIAIQKMVNEQTLKIETNTFTPRNTPSKKVFDDGVICYNDLEYGKEYPNSFFDLMIPKCDDNILQPVLIYMHGGGFLFGSKEAGDPIAKNGEGVSGIFAKILKEGIAVMNMDYANAPEYRFPTQVHQLNQAAEWLLDNGENYGLDTDRILIMGGSAGADLTEIYGLCVADSFYAEKMHIVPVLAKHQVKGLIIDEAFLSLRKTEDENMYTMLGAWLGVDDIAGSNETCLVDVPVHIKNSFLPCYIVASNKEPFFKISADDLAAVLEEKQLQYQYFYPDPEQYGEQVHGFATLNDGSEVSENCFNEMLRFMEKCLRSYERN